MGLTRNEHRRPAGRRARPRPPPTTIPPVPCIIALHGLSAARTATSTSAGRRIDAGGAASRASTSGLRSHPAARTSDHRHASGNARAVLALLECHPRVDRRFGLLGRASALRGASSRRGAGGVSRRTWNAPANLEELGDDAQHSQGIGSRSCWSSSTVTPCRPSASLPSGDSRRGGRGRPRGHGTILHARAAGRALRDHSGADHRLTDPGHRRTRSPEASTGFCAISADAGRRRGTQAPWATNPRSRARSSPARASE